MVVHSLRLLPLVCCLCFIIIISSAEENSQQFQYFCDKNNDRGNYTANSTYDKNLNALLSNLTANTEIDYGFYNSSYGQNTDKVNAIAMCRGDIKPNECRSCLNYAKANLTQLCPNRKEAIGWYYDEICMLRYSDRSIFGHIETGPAYYSWNLNNASNADQFNQVVKNLLDSLRSKAASGGSRRKYSAGTAAAPDNQTIYGLVQCTPDLTGPDCDNCLVQSINILPVWFQNRIGGRVIRPSCSFRYENSSFYEPSAQAPSQSPSSHDAPTPIPSPSPPLLYQPTPSPKGMNNTSSTAATTVPATVPLLLLLGSLLSVSI